MCGKSFKRFMVSTHNRLFLLTSTMAVSLQSHWSNAPCDLYAYQNSLRLLLPAIMYVYRYPKEDVLPIKLSCMLTPTLQRSFCARCVKKSVVGTCSIATTRKTHLIGLEDHSVVQALPSATPASIDGGTCTRFCPIKQKQRNGPTQRDLQELVVILCNLCLSAALSARILKSVVLDNIRSLADSEYVSRAMPATRNYAGKPMSCFPRKRTRERRSITQRRAAPQGLEVPPQRGQKRGRTPAGSPVRAQTPEATGRVSVTTPGDDHIERSSSKRSVRAPSCRTSASAAPSSTQFIIRRSAVTQ